MKKLNLMLVFAALLFFSCQKETQMSINFGRKTPIEVKAGKSILLQVEVESTENLLSLEWEIIFGPSLGLLTFATVRYYATKAKMYYLPLLMQVEM